MKNQSGRSMLEIIGVLSIISVLSIGGLYAYKMAMEKRKVDEILNVIHSRGVVITTSMENKKFQSASEMNEFLSHFNTKVGRYNINFEVPDDTTYNQKMYATKITDEDDLPIQGSICRRLMRSMIEQKIITDVGVTIQEDHDEDGVAETIALRLNGLSVNIDAMCGEDSL